MKSTGLTSLFVALACLSACDRAAHEPATQKTQPQEVQEREGAKAATKVAEPELVPQSGKFRFPAAARLVAIGDLHGDFQATQAAFRLAGAIDTQGKWAGGDLVVVQTGDQLDRGDDEREILEFLQRLKREAKEAGGALHVLSGNHETMNVMGDFRYVTPGALRSFDSYEPFSPLAAAAPEMFRSRAAVFLPGGGVARLLAEQPLIVVVGDTAFAHGGILPSHVDYGIDRLNDETSAWMLGQSLRPPSLVTDEQGPVWTRLYGEPLPSAAACETLGVTLRKLGVRRMAVGHTVQEKGMSAACEGRVYRIDVGLAAYYGDHKAQVLEIRGEKVQILTAP